MTHKEIYEALLETDLPVTFQFWESPDNIPPLPYIVFTYPSNNDYMADDTNYVEITRLEVGLYTKRKSIAVERSVEAVLKQYFNPFFKTSDYVPADSMHETLYTMEVAING
jgi:hypothetical protein